jgi:hypothetical protein
MGEPFDRSSAGFYYRFPSISGRALAAGEFPLRVSRVSINIDRNASDWNKINDSINGTLGLSLSLPPMLLPQELMPVSARRVKNPKPKNYPLNINLSASIKSLGFTNEQPSPFPFFSSDNGFDSAKAGCEFLWSPGIFQFRTRLAITAFANKDNQLEASTAAAVRFKHGRFGLKIAAPDFPEKWNCTLSWRLEY